MSNRIYNKLLENKIENLINSFRYTSRDIFFDEINNRITHPGEFGGYREKIITDFLKITIPKIYGIGDGFIISNNDDVSTQCDIVIYDKEYTPTIEFDSLQKFYTVETVVGIGEAKSRLNKTSLKETLIKLSKVKKIKSTVQEPYILKKKTLDNIFQPTINTYDNIFSFLICEKLDFNLNNLDWDNYFNEVYDNIDINHRHNVILSIEDGFILYKGFINQQITILPYPFLTNNQLLQNNFIKKENNSYRIYKLFASAMFDGISHATVLYPETTKYIVE